MKTAGSLLQTATLIFLLLSLHGTAHAQIRMAAFGGLHSAKVLESNNIPGWDTATGKYYSPRTGFELGVLLEIPVGKKGFYFQPGLSYVSKGRQYSKYNDSAHIITSDTVYTQSTLKLGYITLPLYMTYKMPLAPNQKSYFFLSAGPSICFFYNGSMNVQTMISSSNEYSNQSEDLMVGNAPNKYKTTEISIDGRAGFEFGNVILSGYFSRSLTNFYTAEYAGSFHHQLMGASLGIWLVKPTNTVKPLPTPAAVAADADHDGIPDQYDSCPTVPGTKAWNGCPVPDTDGDGIDDEHDSCRTVPGVIKYHGCPVPDTDGDGIDDDHDSCRTVPGVIKYHGCPIPDRDGDGINDEEDKCPDQPGDKANQGCPITAPPVVKSNAVQFKSASSDLTRESYLALNELASFLIAHRSVHLTIHGYTDNTGSSTFNLSLSKARAETVKNYLVSVGVDPRQLTAIGHGQQDPAAENSSDQGKAVNRRVEFKLEDSGNVK